MDSHWVDSALLLRLLLPVESAEYQEAWALASEADWPWLLPAWQCLLIETGVRAHEHHADTKVRAAASQARQTWERWLGEEVVLALAVDATEAAELAWRWARETPLPLPMNRSLESALAIALQRRVFVSVDPRCRKLAKQGGLALLPAKL